MADPGRAMCPAPACLRGGPAVSVVEAELVLPRRSPVKPLPVPADSADHQLTTAAGALFGYSLRETTGAAAATVEVIDGGDNNARVLAEVVLGAGGSESVWMGPVGIEVGSGVRVHVVSGTVKGAVWATLS